MHLFFLLCGGVFVGVFGTVVIVYSIRTARRGSASERWPVVEGKILRSEVKEDRSGGKICYDVAVEFEYSVGGNVLTSDNVQFGGLTGSTSKSQITEIADAYRAGQRVEVHYDPADPTVATLETGTGGALVVIAIAAAIILLWSIWWVIQQVRVELS